ncbi:MAG: adenylate kinase [Bacteroidales bacterium]|jgi:adenylate kinase|nr:adenylate kinase [Bacteroidales bacterium]
MFNIVLLGAPGSGKGTQAALLKEELDLEHVSTGALFREEIASGSEIGQKAEHLIAKGHLCPDDITLDILNSHIQKHQDKRGFLLDGVPRTLKQAKMMDGIHYEFPVPIALVINIDINDHEVISRIHKRALEENRADDSSNEILEQRMTHYHNLTKPLINYYQKQNKLVIIDGMQSIEKVFADIVAKIKEL